IQDAYVRRVIDAVGDLDNVLYEIDNEGDATSKAWQYHMIQLIRDYEATRPKQHPIGITAMWPSGSDTDLFNSGADWVSPTGNLDNPAAASGSKVVLADTDHLCGICGNVAWVWRSLTRGQNPILMDGYDGAAIGLGASDYSASNPVWEAIRKNMGYARSYANRMNLAAAIPRGDLASSGYCLAVVGSEYLVLLPTGGSVGVNLTGVTGARTVEWFNPASGQTIVGASVNGGRYVTITAPFSGTAVAYIHP
ncbi:MAG TPA: putative collagen-binding domain-containing protein, partial [Gemmatimonadaceae bacterium]|nr:putative collagen-binding domain-containing protein [Gemmatimonadaceae bacterium]